ncbi:NAD-dependent epimerase/dehydratase family protein [Mycolicibacterium fluoranthenivorans]|uniref:NAD-dependent epimerase/dehydratase family protein n=1 Tax=Mycolicibacterium fluoranthenivorans TaxID=258505 RepID=A0A7G8PHK0_9MYCO|nr:NAD-dependent epimerase/dehydratase family protein [Mycolicibacterium fluoranthenivorans]QNJ93816.1 NAD-dependent epimerase/dehydratase family protein [Mycolicibacterium fluoranthenivorans]
MTRILITGGAGFIGSRLATALNADGHTVTMLDNLLPQVHGVDSCNSELLGVARAAGDVVVGDITDRQLLQQTLAGQEVVIHLAAETGTGQSMYEIERYSRVNVGGTALLLDILANDRSRSVTKVVVASSRSIYGEGRYFSEELGYVYPETRDELDLLAGRFEPTVPGDKSGLKLVGTSEDSQIHPSSVYGITKHTQESLIMTVGPTLGIATVALRYQNVYGPGQSLSNPYTGILSIFSTLIRQGKGINVFEDGLESRDFVYIDDVVRATAQAALDPRADGQVFNVGSGVGTTVNTVVEELMRAYGRTVPVEITGNFRLGDIRHNVADLTRVREVLGFEPKVDFRTGVEAFAQWVQDQELTEGGYEASLQEMREKNLLK